MVEDLEDKVIGGFETNCLGALGTLLGRGTGVPDCCLPLDKSISNDLVNF